ncbi:MAG: right-handed parallel beta-helix repeat-containing protein, partial [Lachnospiraceae bacterium]|nr:right-handed parallel beta-helix repeat-containing protein [Lachnospiraceae bacterium]
PTPSAVPVIPVNVDEVVFDYYSDWSYTYFDGYVRFEKTVTNKDELVQAIDRTKVYSNKSYIRFKITAEPGTYKLGAVQKPSSYTEFEFKDGAVINGSSISGKYFFYIGDGKTDISIDGGTFKGKGIVANKAKNITIKNATFDSVSHDAIVLKGENGNCVIENNTIISPKENGIWLCTSKMTGDVKNNTVTKAGEISIYIYKATLKGGIIENTIKNSGGSGIYAGYSAISGDIKGNSLSKVKSKGIGIYHASHCRDITENKLVNMGGAHNGFNGDVAIMINADEGASKKGKKTYARSITNNYINGVTYSGIALYSGPSGSKDKKFNQDKAFVKENISGNTVINAGTYKHSKNWKKEIKKGGKVGVQAGIYADVHSRVYGKINSNTIKKTNQHGIYVRVGAIVKSIEKNSVTNVKEDGIGVYYAKVNKIINNTVTKAKRAGIYAREKAKINLISGNKVKKCKKKIAKQNSAKVKKIVK